MWKKQIPKVGTLIAGDHVWKYSSHINGPLLIHVRGGKGGGSQTSHA